MGMSDHEDDVAQREQECIETDDQDYIGEDVFYHDRVSLYNGSIEVNLSDLHMSCCSHNSSLSSLM